MNDTKSDKPTEGDNHLGPSKTQSGPDHDPVNLMSQVFEEIGIFIGPAQDVLLSWLLRLPKSMPPAEAAQRTLKGIVAGQTEGATPEAIQLIELLSEVATHSKENLKKSGQDRRRGGRAGRFLNRLR